MKTETRHCKHGTFTYFSEDEYVGKSLALYGEYSDEEVLLFRKVLRPGDVAIDVGANIGALTVPMAKFVGENGRVIAFEAQPATSDLLRKNLQDNFIHNVEVRKAVSSRPTALRVPYLDELGHKNFGASPVVSGLSKQVANTRLVPADTIDSLGLENVKFIKMDIEGYELEALKGAQQTINRCRPILYIENDRAEKSEALIAFLIDCRYRLYWHRPPLYNPKNFFAHKPNVFGAIVSINMVCVPEESGIEVTGLDEVADLRVDDDMYNREFSRHMRAVTRNPDDLTARLMAAHYSNMMQRHDVAQSLLEENLRRDPEHIGTKAIAGLLRLQSGIYDWAAYELRYHQKAAAAFGARPRNGQKWDGSPTQERLLIWSEQGFGDSIMFSRFLPMLLSVAPNAFLEIQPQLYELFEISGLHIGEMFRLGRKLPDYALHCSIPSLCAALKIGPDEIRQFSKPYLFADPAMVESWRKREHPRIGFCWAGSPRSERPMTRDLPVKMMEELNNEFGPFISLTQEGQFESYADTAALIADLDLVITVDTSVAHLAGAMGKETWLLLSFDPDWRWGLRGSKTIWYPNMRIFRQPRFRDWESVVMEVRKALTAR